jgi:WD40 repeat protein/nucleoside phosphorylase/predicted nucleotidyltransferase
MTGIREKATASHHLKADILLVTVTSGEAQAVLRLFAEETGQAFQRHFIGNKTYFDLGTLRDARIMMVQAEMGAFGALLAVDDGTRALSPSAVIMVGIAFGVDDRTQSIGDILVSRQLLGYEVQKLAGRNDDQVENILYGDRVPAPTKLLDRFRSGVLDWDGPKVTFGLILSGDKLVDRQDFQDQLRKLAPEAIGGELEGTGLYSAAQRRNVDWILVKGICDWVGSKKGEDKDHNQQIAAENAVRFTLHVLKQGGFVEDIPRISPPSPITSKRNSLPPPVRGTLLRKYDVHAGWVLTVAWEPNGNRIASAGGDGTVRIWDAETGESLLTNRSHSRWLNKANLQTTIYTVAWAPEGLRIVSAGHGASVHVWNATTGQTLTLYQGHSGVLPDVFAVAWSPDGKRIASACSSIGLDKTLHVWDAVTGQLLSCYDVRSGWGPHFSVLSVAWSPDGTRIAATCDDKVIRVWSTETGQLVSTYRFRSEAANHITWSPNSQYLASAHTDHTAQIWDTFTKKKVMAYHKHTDSVRCIAWSPDGTSVATASNDKTVHIWDPLTGKCIYVYRGHANWTTSVTWSPDGTRIASASNDQTVHIWQAVKEVPISWIPQKQWLEELVQARREDILRTASRYGAYNVRIFGSVARGTADERSDLDLLVDMEPGRSLFDLGGLSIDLEELLGCPVDVVTEQGLRDSIRSDVLQETVPL